MHMQGVIRHWESGTMTAGGTRTTSTTWRMASSVFTKEDINLVRLRLDRDNFQADAAAQVR
jgi:hypothetical protein